MILKWQNHATRQWHSAVSQSQDRKIPRLARTINTNKMIMVPAMILFRRQPPDSKMSLEQTRLLERPGPIRRRYSCWTDIHIFRN